MNQFASNIELNSVISSRHWVSFPVLDGDWKAKQFSLEDTNSLAPVLYIKGDLDGI